MNRQKNTPLKVMQIAAYQSNIGDNANLSGTRKLFQSIFLDYEIVYTDIELSDFSWGLKSYDADFLAEIQHHDLLLIGGGGFLELIPGTESWTGTRVNIPQAFLDKLTIPVIFYALGIDTVRADLEGINFDSEIKKLKNFIDYASTKENILLSTRHDGSILILDKLLGKHYSQQFTLIGDGGFFTTYDEAYHSEIKPKAINIAINFGGDLLKARFSEKRGFNAKRKHLGHNKRPADYEVISYTENKGFNDFLVEFSNVCREIVQQYGNVNFIFVPHIYRDIEMGFYLISELGFPYTRRNITMAPYLNGESGKNYIVDLYRQCDLVIGMRFHANLCPIAVGTPSIGLKTFPMIEHLYDSLGLSEHLIAPKSATFEKDLLSLVRKLLRSSENISSKYNVITKDLESKTKKFIKKIYQMTVDNIKT